MLAPAISHYNIFFYQNIETILRMQRFWYSAARRPVNAPNLNSTCSNDCNGSTPDVPDRSPRAAVRRP